MFLGKRGAVNYQILVFSLLIAAAMILSSLNEGITGQILYRPEQARPYCGDGACFSPFESECTCPQDCMDVAYCGDNCATGDSGQADECDGSDDGQCPGQCQGDCTCGGGTGNCDFDGICETGETFQSCPSDCQQTCEEAAQQTGGRVFYVNPATGSDSGSGTQNDPWKTLKNVVDSGKLGTTIVSNDVVCLYDGNHGSTISITNILFTFPVFVMAQKDQNDVRIGKLNLNNVDYVTFDRLRISPSFAGLDNFCLDIVHTEYSAFIEIKNSEIFTALPSETDTWTMQEWKTKPSLSGIRAMNSAANHVFTNNKIYTVINGINVQGNNNMQKNNIVDGIVNDGLKYAGDNYLLEGNLVQNFIDVGNDCPPCATQCPLHHDGIQGYTGGGIDMNNIIIRNNQVYESTPSFPAPANKANMQGISQFGNKFVNSLIENNVVWGRHWWGIGVDNGMDNTEIKGNTVYGCINPGGDGRMRIWIKPPVTNSFVWNNIAGAIVDESGSADANHNKIISTCDGADDAAYFINVADRDFHLKPTAPAVDAGNSAHAPSDDFEDDIRPCGSNIDIGADEVCS